jgi:hypothetical protein
MDINVLRTFGQVAGLAGLSVGVVLLLFRDGIRKNIFSSLTREHSLQLIRLILIIVWSLAIIGISAWTYAESEAREVRWKQSVGKSPNLPAEKNISHTAAPSETNAPPPSTTHKPETPESLLRNVARAHSSSASESILHQHKWIIGDREEGNVSLSDNFFDPFLDGQSCHYSEYENQQFAASESQGAD